MTNCVVGNGIHLPSLVVSTVGVVSPTVLDATDAFSRSSGFRRGSTLLQKHQIKSRFAYVKWKV